MLHSDIPTILGRLRDNDQARPARKKPRQPQREARPDKERTLTAIRALMAEGSPARAVQLLTSACLHDPDDQTVQIKLAELHPVGARIMAPLPITWKKQGYGGPRISKQCEGSYCRSRQGAQGDRLV